MEDLFTSRLKLRALQLDDAPFIYELVTDRDWLTYIGDKGVHNLDDAKGYITNGPQAMYKKHGFGLLVVETIEHKKPLGLCGLLQRDNLTMPDIGFAYMPAARGQGFATEAAQAVIDYAFKQLNVECLAGITTPHNQASIKLLQKLGFVFVGSHQMSQDSAYSNLYQRTKTA